MNLCRLSLNMTEAIFCTFLIVCLFCLPFKNKCLQLDLVNTIGEAAALGAAGAISWGDMNVTDTEVESDITLRFSGKVLNLIFSLQTY